METRRRVLCFAVLVSFLTNLAAPALLAQDFGSGAQPTAGSTAGPPQTAAGPYPAADNAPPSSAAEYISNVQARVSLRDYLEGRYTQAQGDQSTYAAQIAQWQAATPPPNVDPQEFEKERQAEITRLQEAQTQNTQMLGGYRQQLGTVYSWINQDRQFVSGANDPQLSQSLGTLIGVGGTAVVPVWSRPTPANLGAAWKNSANIKALAKTTSQIGDLTGEKDLVAARMANRTAPKPGNWSTQVDDGGNITLVNGDKTVDLGVKATTKSASGEEIKNTDAFAKADYYRELYNSKSSITSSIDKLTQARAQAKDAQTIKDIDQKIADLQQKQSDLNSDIEKYKDTKPKGSAITGLMASAAKWAAMSAGITVGANVISQLSQNGWDVKSVNWGQAIAPLMTPEFWGGTAGSFAVSMVASMIPGGAFIKTLASIGGAAIGWQLGTGNLFQTDWAQLATDTVGSTLGFLLGSAIAGPIGGFIGGIAGQWAANWLLGKIRDYLETPSTSYSPFQGTYGPSVDPYQNYRNYTGSSLGANAPQPGSSPPPPFTLTKTYTLDNLAELKADLDQAHQDYQTLAQDPGINAGKLAQKQQEIDALNTKLDQLRQQAASQSGGY